MTTVSAWWPGLLETAAALGGWPPEAIQPLLSAAEVDPGAAPNRRPPSSLNNDGTPIQVCVAVAPASRTVRLLVDPACGEPDPVRRCARGLTACRRLLRSLADRRLPAAFQRRLRAALPDSASLRTWLPSGSLWLGTDPPGRGIAAYVSARWGAEPSRWPRVFGWLDGLPAPEASASLRALPAVAEPASLGLEATCVEDLRAKVYFRLRRPCPLAGLSLPGLTSPEVEHFLARVIGDQRLSRSGLLVSVAVHPDSTAPPVCKIDLCAHCVRHSPARWAGLLEALAREFGLQPPALSEFLLAGKAEVAFVGFRAPADKPCQLNCYLKAKSPESPPESVDG